MGVRRVGVGVETRAPTGTTNAYLLGDDDALLVDPGGRDPALDDAVTDCDVAHVAVTHHHPDHCGGVADYAARTGATVWARAGRVDAFEAATGTSPDRTFRPGATILTGDGPITVLDTPGHTPEHVAFVHHHGVACGDLAVAEGSVAVAAPEGDLRAYLTSLRRVHATHPPRLFPGHGPVIDDVRSTCERLLAHRRDRERRVLAAVAGGARTIPDVTDAAYDKDVADVRDLAEATVEAHVEKLAVENRVRWNGTRVTPA